MTKDQKVEMVDNLSKKFAGSNFFYITDSSSLTVAEINRLRRLCHKNGIHMQVAKNTLISKALTANGDKFSELHQALTGPTSLMFSEVSNSPAKVIKEFRKDGLKPILKAAYIDTDIYIGDQQLETLASLKSRNELIADILLLLQSPAKNVISALQSSANKLSGIIKTLSERQPAGETGAEA